MCWSEQFRYGAYGHYVRENFPCPTQQDSHRYEPDWLTECQMFDCQPAQRRPGFCGRCGDFHLGRYAHNPNEASNSDIDRSSRFTRSDTTGSSSQNTSNSTISLTPPTSDNSDDSRVRGIDEHKEGARSNPTPRTRTASNGSYGAAEMQNSAPPTFHGRPIDHGRSIHSMENRRTSRGYYERVRRTQERLAEDFGLTRIREGGREEWAYMDLM